jgi:hypothetical protein
MSGSMFLVEFQTPPRTAPPMKVLSTLREIAKEMDGVRKAGLAALEWVSVEDITDRVVLNVDEPVYEVTVSSSLTNDVKVSREVLRVYPVDERRFQVIMTDASLPLRKCEEVVVEFAKGLYEKATGEKIDNRMVRVQRVAALLGRVCEHCLQTIPELPYTCKVCGRVFCYEHRRPESHGCGHPYNMAQEEASTQHNNPSSADSNSEDLPRIVISKVLCG